MKRITILAILLCCISTVTFAQKSKDIKSSSEVIDKLFVAMQKKDVQLLREVLVADAQFVAVINPRDGKGEPMTRTNTVEGFTKAITGTSVEIIERMPNKDVVISDNLALVSGRYTLHIGEKFSHCGTNTFNLLRVKDTWKILSTATTYEYKCEADLKNINIPIIEADPIDVLTIEGIIKALYETISGGVGEPRKWGRDRTLYMPDIRFVTINSNENGSRVNRVTQQNYVNSSNEFMVKSGFTEREINRVTRRFGNLAQVFSTYEWETADKKSKGRGINSIQLFYDGKRWWVSALAWENEHKGNPIPTEFLPSKK